MESCGLKATLVKMSTADANIQYRQCFDSQVIKTHPKSKTKVERGTAVLVKYIPQEVIDESQRMFDISEKHKEEQHLEKSIKRTERKENTKRVVNGIISTVQESAKKIPSAFHKSTEKEDHNEQEQEERNKEAWLRRFAIGLYFGVMHRWFMAYLDFNPIPQKQ